MNILQEIEAHVLPAAQLHDEGFPSASLAILDASGAITTHVITSGPETPTTLYQAASVSKAITGLAVARLIDDGVLSYDTRVAAHIPTDIAASLAVPPTSAALLDAVTVGMLISHRAGLSYHGGFGYDVPEDTVEETADGFVPTYAQLFAGTPPTNHPRVRFLSVPGAEMRYSGGGYALLQLFLENFLREDFAALMHRLVLAPLGMTRSHFGPLPAGEKNYTRGYFTAELRNTKTGTRGHADFRELAAAGLWSTPEDLLKAVRAVQRSLYPPSPPPHPPATSGDAGSLDGANFLRAETAHRMLEMPPVDAGPGGMAMGWRVTKQAFGHAGENWPGHRTYVFGSREDPQSGALQAGTGVAVMANSYADVDTLWRLVLAIFARQNWTAYRALPGFGTFDEMVPYPARNREGLSPAVAAEWVGQWAEGWEILRDEEDVSGGGLRVRFGELGPSSSLRLLPAATPARTRHGFLERTMVVEGLSVALRLTQDADTREKVLVVVQSRTKKLRRADAGAADQ